MYEVATFAQSERRSFRNAIASLLPGVTAADVVILEVSTLHNRRRSRTLLEAGAGVQVRSQVRAADEEAASALEADLRVALEDEPRVVAYLKSAGLDRVSTATLVSAAVATDASEDGRGSGGVRMAGAEIGLLVSGIVLCVGAAAMLMRWQRAHRPPGEGARRSRGSSAQAGGMEMPMKTPPVTSLPADRVLEGAPQWRAPSPSWNHVIAAANRPGPAPRQHQQQQHQQQQQQQDPERLLTAFGGARRGPQSNAFYNPLLAAQMPSNEKEPPSEAL